MRFVRRHLLLAMMIAVASCSTREGESRASTPPPTTSAQVPISTSADAPGAQGWLLCLSTDKPLYHPGEPMCVRVVVLDALTHAPCALRMPLCVRLADPRGVNLFMRLAWTTDGVATTTWSSDLEAPTGAYHLSVETSAVPAASAERRILLSSERVSALDLDVVFSRALWLPGETATATLRAVRHDGSPAAGCSVRAVATCAGTPVMRGSYSLRSDGTISFPVSIPTLPLADVLLDIAVEDHGVPALTSRVLPIATAPVVELIPESGQLVAGLLNQVYVHAWRAAGAPLAIVGVVEDENGTEMATVRTDQEGRGRVSFIPTDDRRYQVRVREPACITATFALPEMVRDGVLLHSRDQRCAAGAPLRLEVTSVVAQHLRVEIRHREQLIATLPLACPARQPQTVELALPDAIDGVLVATVIAADGDAVAERLVFREPVRRLRVGVVPDRDRHAPGEDASVTVQVRDEQGRPVAALVGVAVFDAGAEVALAARDRPPQLPAMALLEGEVEQLGDAAHYLDGTPAGDVALDLLLGCQDWRRFLARRDPAWFASTGRERFVRRLLLNQRRLPTWPHMLPGNPDLPYPALSSRHHGVPLGEPGFSSSGPLVSSPGLDRGLLWLWRFQQADGGWDPAAALPEIARDARETGIAPWQGADARCSATALSLLVILGAGYDHKTPNKYRQGVAKGLAWLMAQPGDGNFSADPSVQAIVTESLCEAYAMTNDQELKPLCQRAIDVILARQVQYRERPLGWAATIADAPVCDADASAWCVMALKSALAAGLPVGHGLEGAKEYLQAAWLAANGSRRLDPATDSSTFPARWDPRTGQCRQPHLPAAGLLMAIFLGHHAGDVLAETLANHAYDLYYPVAPPFALIECYRTTLGIFQLGGERWQRWNDMYHTLLVEIQHSGEGSAAGSWGPHLFDAFAVAGGRVITTALASLPMEIYPRGMTSGVKREQAHRPEIRGDDGGHDLAPTVYWNAGVRSDPTTGEATFHFKAAERITDYRILVDAVDARGALGSGTGLMR